MKRGRSATLVVFTAALASRNALGQPAPPAKTAQPTAPAPSAATAPASAPLPVTALPDVPPAPPVSDPMLAPVPPPKRLIASWDEASRLLRARSTDLRRAHDDILRAEADSRTALAAILPTLNATGTATHTILPKAGNNAVVDTSGLLTGGNSYSGSVRASLSVINVQAWHAIGTAHVNEDATRLGYQDLERTTAASLATAIAQNVTAERVSELGRVGLKNALERLALTEAKERTGTALGLDIAPARENGANARRWRVNRAEALRRSRDTLGLAVGLPEPVGVLPTTDLSSIGQSVLKACRALPDLEHRPDVLAAGKAVEVSERRRAEVDQGFLPTLGVGSTLAATTTDFTNTRPTGNVQAVLSVPLWGGGARYGARRGGAALPLRRAPQRRGRRRSNRRLARGAPAFEQRRSRAGAPLGRGRRRVQ